MIMISLELMQELPTSLMRKLVRSVLEGKLSLIHNSSLTLRNCTFCLPDIS